MLSSAISAATLAAVLAACHAGASAPPPSAPPPSATAALTCEWCGADEAPPGLSATMRLAPPGMSASASGEALVVSGIVRGADGQPLGGVLVYAYHTDPAGRYTPSQAPHGNEARHGRLRGWLVTGTDGQYRIETTRPGAYPGRPDPQHIHLAMRREGDAERYAGEIVFADDPRLTAAWQAGQRRTGNAFTVCAPVRDAAGVWHLPCDLRAPGRDALAAPTGGAAGTGTRVVWASGLAVPERDRWFDVDAAATTIRWEGFSLRGSHEGTLRASSGWLRYGPGGRLVGGEVVVPLASLDVTDFPDHPASRARLRAHLLAEAFFAADRFPSARLVVTGASAATGGRRRVTARLTMRGVTHAVAFDAAERVRRDGAVDLRARLRLDRQRWGVRFRRARDLVVRDAFDLDVTLVAPPRT